MCENTELKEEIALIWYPLKATLPNGATGPAQLSKVEAWFQEPPSLDTQMITTESKTNRPKKRN